MPESQDLDSGPHWDEVVDVICVGPGLGALSYGLCCAAADLDVLLVEAPVEPDPVLAGLLGAMTEDLGDPQPDPGLAVIAAGPEPAPVPSGRRSTMKSPLGAPLEPFVGHQLRDFSARCLASPYGVMFSQVPDILTPMRTGTGESITVAILGPYRPPLDAVLREQAEERGLTAQDRLVALVVDGGRIAGAALQTSSGPWLVGANAGIAVSVGPMPSVLPQPEEADHAGNLDVAVVGRRFGRFARVELLRR